MDDEQNANELNSSNNLEIDLDENEGMGKQPAKCLICAEAYESATISVNCWHVYCQKCWFNNIKAKKSCPQCNSVTQIKDLRRIFL